MGIILGALAGAGKAMGEIADQNTRLWNAQDLAQQQSQLEIAKAKAIADYSENKTIAAEQRSEESLKRFGGIVNSMRNAQVPVAPDPVTQLSGQGNAFDGQPLQQGLKGSPDKLRAQINQWPDGDDKQNALKQLDSQFATDTKNSKDAVAGKTRAPTSEEAVQMARDAAMASDPVALAAYEKSIGKSARDDRRLDISEKRSDDIQQFNMRRLDRLDALTALKDSHDRARQEILDGKLDAQTERAELNSRRAAIIELTKSTEHEMERAMAQAKDPMMDTAMAKTYQQRVERLTSDLGRYRKALETFGGDSIPAQEKMQEKMPEPSVKYDSQGNAYVKGPDGKPVLKSDAEKSATPETYVKPPEQNVTQNFNQAGYADTQSTIDGAKRGDKRATALLDVLIAQGETTPEQRRQIAQIKKGQ